MIETERVAELVHHHALRVEQTTARTGRTALDVLEVAAALRSLTYEGLCDPNYKSDSEQILHHQSYFLTFTANGERKVVRRFTVPDPGTAAATTTTTG